VSRLRDSPGQPRHGLLELPGDEGQAPELRTSRRQGGLELQCGEQLGPRLGELPAKPVGEGEVVARMRILGHEGDGLPQTGGGFVLTVRPEQRKSSEVRLVHGVDATPPPPSCASRTYPPLS